MNKSEILGFIARHKDAGMTLHRLDGLCFGKGNKKRKLWQAVKRNKKIPKDVAEAVAVQMARFDGGKQQ